METSFSFLDELVCATTEDNGCCLAIRAATKYVESFITYLLFLKYLTRTKYLFLKKRYRNQLAFSTKQLL